MTDRNTESMFHLECVEQAVVHKLPETVHNISIRMKCLSWCLVASVRVIAKKISSMTKYDVVKATDYLFIIMSRHHVWNQLK